MGECELHGRAALVARDLADFTPAPSPAAIHARCRLLGEISGTKATAALADVAKRDVGDRWVRVAVLSSCYGRSGKLYALLAAVDT